MSGHLLKRREGFTLIELLIVVVIIGILAAIAIPKFSSVREKAYVSAMQADLRNLSTAQEIYYSTNYVYAGGTFDGTVTPSTKTGYSAGLEFTGSNGVLVTITANTTDAALGWKAVADHEATDRDCAVYYGVVAAVPTPDPGTSGSILCDP